MASASKQYLTKRVAAVVVACLLLALIWFNPNSQSRLRQTYKSLSDKQAKQSAGSTASALTGEQQPGSDARPQGVTIPQTNISNEPLDTDATPHKVLSPPIILSDESPDLNTQPHKVTSPPIMLADESPDLDVQPPNITSTPIELADESPDLDAQPHKVTSLPIELADESPDLDAQSPNITSPPIEVTDEPLAVDEQADEGVSTTTNITYKSPEFDAQSINFTTPSISDSSQKPFPPLPPADDEEYMAICMAVKDQHLDLPEFFSHHYHHLGIRRFYIFDDGSQPPLSTASYPIPTSAITWIYFQPHVHSTRLNERKGIQERYYTGCVKMFGVQHSWMGFLDADEYLEMTGNETLSDFLRGWERNSTVGAVGVSWINHSSAGILTRPADGPRKAYDRCIIDNPHNDNIKVKTWVRPSLFGYMNNCHCMRNLKNGAIEVGEHGDLITRNCDRLPITRDRWALHHFGTKSREEFLQKQERGKIRGGKAPEHFWRKIENEEQVDCLELTKYVP